MTRNAARAALAALAFFVPLWATAAQAEDPTVELTIRDHRFVPETLEVPANKRITLVVHNADPTPEEFESYDLNREKVIAGNSKVTIHIGPLEPGAFPFFGEFHMKTAKGRIVAK